CVFCGPLNNNNQYTIYFILFFSLQFGICQFPSQVLQLQMEFLQVSGPIRITLYLCLWNRAELCYSNLCRWQLLQIPVQPERRMHERRVRTVFGNDRRQALRRFAER
ncbi:hypothetical protein AB205_0181670, partial [Aquarana catesbeiana]